MPYCDLELHDSLYFSMHLRDFLKCNAYIHACTVSSFNRLFGNFMTLLTTEQRRMLIVSCALIYDDG